MTTTTRQMTSGKELLWGEPYLGAWQPDADEPDIVGDALRVVSIRLLRVNRHIYEAITKQNETLEDQFRTLADRWYEDTQYQSSIHEITGHPAYQAIIGLGNRVVPLILRELERRPAFWFTALRAITGANPVAPEQRGRIQAMRDAWLQWGNSQNLH